MPTDDTVVPIGEPMEVEVISGGGPATAPSPADLTEQAGSSQQPVTTPTVQEDASKQQPDVSGLALPDSLHEGQNVDSDADKTLTDINRIITEPISDDEAMAGDQPLGDNGREGADNERGNSNGAGLAPPDQVTPATPSTSNFTPAGPPAGGAPPPPPRHQLDYRSLMLEAGRLHSPYIQVYFPSPGEVTYRTSDRHHYRVAATQVSSGCFCILEAPVEAGSPANLFEMLDDFVPYNYPAYAPGWCDAVVMGQPILVPMVVVFKSLPTLTAPQQ